MTVSTSGAADEPHGLVSDIPLRKIEVDGLSVEVPELLVDCFEYILERGLVEGIFRISGSIKRMRGVTSDYPAYKNWLENNSPLPHDVSGVAKKFTRDYLHSIGGLFLPLVLSSLRALFALQPRKNSVLSTESYRSTSTSYSSGLDSVCEEPEDAEYSTSHSVGEKLDSVASLLVSKNSARKNGVFIYYLSVLKCVSVHQEQTRMPNANLAIVFQQYLFETWVVNDLQSYQKLLEFLLENFEEFLAKYRLTLSLLGGVEDFETTVENGSMIFSDSISTSPLTEYSLHQASPPKFSISGSFDGRRRSSLSQKLGSFWDVYSSPANRRFSFASRGSGRSSERLPIDSQEQTPQNPHRDGVFVPNLSTSHEDLIESSEEESFPCEETQPRAISTDPATWTQALVQALVSRTESKRKSFMGFSKTRDEIPIADQTKTTTGESPMLDLSLTNNYSIDSLGLDSSQKSFPSHLKRHSLSRRFSLWLKKN